MKLTEKQLLEGLNGVTKGGSLCSTINGEDFVFEYRNRQSDCNPVCEPFKANNISYFSRNDDIVHYIDTELTNDNELVKKVQERYNNWADNQ